MALVIRNIQDQDHIHVYQGGEQHEGDVEDDIESQLKLTIVAHRLQQSLQQDILLLRLFRHHFTGKKTRFTMITPPH